MTIDAHEALWLKDFILECLSQLESHPGMTIEIANRPLAWLQAIFIPDDDLSLASVSLNFRTEGKEVTSNELLAEMISLPPGTVFLESVTREIISLSLRSDIPPMVLSLLILHIFESFLDRTDDNDLLVQVEGGY